MDLAAVERAPDPHPSVAEAEPRVGRSPIGQRPIPRKDVGTADRDAAEELQQAAAAMGVQPGKGADIPEEVDVAILRRDGRLTAEDEASLAEADRLAKQAEGWATANEVLAGCVLRYEP